jgi:hypothetical protein
MKILSRIFFRLAAIFQKAAVVLEGGEEITLQPAVTLTHFVAEANPSGPINLSSLDIDMAKRRPVLLGEDCYDLFDEPTNGQANALLDVKFSTYVEDVARSRIHGGEQK